MSLAVNGFAPISVCQAAKEIAGEDCDHIGKTGLRSFARPLLEVFSGSACRFRSSVKAYAFVLTSFS